LLQIRKDESSGARVCMVPPQRSKTDADRLMAFLKPLLSSFHRGEPGFTPATPTPAPAPVPAPPPPPPQIPPPAPVVTRDQRLHGLWYAPILRSGSDSMTMFRFRYFAYDGRFAQGGESYATFVRRSSDGSWDGMDTLRSKLPSGRARHVGNKSRRSHPPL